MDNFLLKLFGPSSLPPDYLNALRKIRLFFIASLAVVALVTVYVETASDSYQLAKRFIRTSPFIKSNVGEVIDVASVPSFVSRGDSTYYFTTVFGSKRSMEVLCVMYADSDQKLHPAYVVKDEGQFAKLKKVK